MKLNKLRKKIDTIDEKILGLLNQRAKEAIKVSKVKQDTQLKNYSPEREAKLFARLKRLGKGPLAPEDVEMIFGEIVSVCRSLRKTLTVAYLGPKGTFTHLASIKKFGRKSDYIPADSISNVFEKVEKGEVDFGVVPVENSIEGVVNYTLDMFFSSPLKICSEIVLNISHSLMGRSSKNIKKVYSNPQVFAQCRRWIMKNLPNAELIPTSSTAKAAQLAKKNPNSACMGSSMLAEIYGLKRIARSIEDASSNVTRFLVIAKEDSQPSDDDKTSLLFSIKDRVGALYDVLYSFKQHKINLTKIESRPSKKKVWDYYFFVDFVGHRDSPKFKKALKELKKNCLFVKVLGSYPRGS